MTRDQDRSLGHPRVGSVYSANDNVYMGRLASIYTVQNCSHQVSEGERQINLGAHFTGIASFSIMAK